MTRSNTFRGLSAAVVAVALLLATTATGATDQKNQSRGVTSIVLVHGAWADGSSWSKVIPLLEAKGLHVVAVESKGCDGQIQALPQQVQLGAGFVVPRVFRLQIDRVEGEPEVLPARQKRVAVARVNRRDVGRLVNDARARARFSRTQARILRKWGRGSGGMDCTGVCSTRRTAAGTRNGSAF